MNRLFSSPNRGERSETTSKLKRLTGLQAGSFDQVFLEASEKVLCRVFGDRVTELILERVKSLNASVHEDQDTAKALSDTLGQILGPGSVPVERLILRQLYSGFESNFEQKSGYHFIDYVDELKRTLESDNG